MALKNVIADMRTCVLIDDDIDDREIFEIALDQAKIGARVFHFKNGHEALQKISENSFLTDYIFLDINMPEMSGKECLLEIKKIRHLKSVPVYMYSTSPHDQDQFLSHGATQVISKPAKMSDLISVLKEIIV